MQSVVCTYPCSYHFQCSSFLCVNPYFHVITFILKKKKIAFFCLCPLTFLVLWVCWWCFQLSYDWKNFPFTLILERYFCWIQNSRSMFFSFSPWTCGSTVFSFTLFPLRRLLSPRCLFPSIWFVFLLCHWLYLRFPLYPWFKATW